RRSRFPEPALKITACKCPPFEARVQFSTRDRLRWNEEHTPLAEATKTRHEERARTLTYTKSHTLPISGCRHPSVGGGSRRDNGPRVDRFVDLSHLVADGMLTYPGLPAPRISDHLSREESRHHYESGTEFHIGRIEMVGNTGTYLDTPFHRYADGHDLVGLPLDRVAELEGVVVRV